MEGMVKIIMDTKKPITGKNILVVEDIIDSGNSQFLLMACLLVHVLGLTMKYLLEILRTRNPKSLETAVLLVKPGAKYPIVPKYFGWEVQRDQFIVGYGLDYAGMSLSQDILTFHSHSVGNYRCLSYVGILKEEVYRKK
jgi:hypoxanthine phosphoribosyltransferase